MYIDNIYLMYNVYLICSEINNEKIYKIGYTKRPIEKRLKEFKTGNGAEIYLVDSFTSKWGTKIERNLHKFYIGKKVSGEWFKLSDSDLKTFKDKCISIHENLNFIESNNTYYIDKIKNKI